MCHGNIIVSYSNHSALSDLYVTLWCHNMLAQLNLLSIQGSYWLTTEISLVLLHSALWLVKKTRAILQPIRCKTKENRDFVIRVFPRFKPASRFHLEFSSANDYVIPCSDWSLGLLWFGFSTINWKLLWDLTSWGVDQLLCPYNNCDKLFLSWQYLYAICCNPISFAHPNSFRHLWVLLHFVIVN